SCPACAPRSGVPGRSSPRASAGPRRPLAPVFATASRRRVRAGAPALPPPAAPAPARVPWPGRRACRSAAPAGGGPPATGPPPARRGPPPPRLLQGRPRQRAELFQFLLRRPADGEALTAEVAQEAGHALRLRGDDRIQPLAQRVEGGPRRGAEGPHGTAGAG